MKTLIATIAAAAVVAIAGPANAKGVFETLNEIAPKAPIFVELDRTAPRADVFETLNQTAPKHPIFILIDRNAP
jgi:hypothetical protein